MKIFQVLLLTLAFSVISCAGNDVIDNGKDEDEKTTIPSANTKDDANKPDVNNDAKTEILEEKKETELEPKKEDKQKPTKPDEYATKYEYAVLESENPRQMRIQTAHSYIEINFNAENSIVDFFTEELAEKGNKHITKICVDYVEFYFERIAKWLEQGESKPAYEGICLVLHELTDNADVPKPLIPENMKDFPVIMLNLNEFNTTELIRRLWLNLLPIESEIIRTGIAFVNPSIKKTSIVEYYKFMPVMRISVKFNDFFISSSPFDSEFYNLQRADFVSYMLENSESLKDFLSASVDNEAFKKLYANWRKNRRQFFDNDKLPEHFRALYHIEKGNCKNGLNILQKIDEKTLKTEEGQFLKLVELMFYTQNFQYIRQYLNEQVLTVDFLMKIMPKDNKAVLYNQLRVPISILIVGIFQNELDFNKDLAVFLDKLGYVLLGKFLLYSENIISDIEILRKNSIKEVEEFLKLLPPCYAIEFTWWYYFIRMVSELKFGFVSSAKELLNELSKISSTNTQIALAGFVFELYSK
ncbi:MAG: hypothetical protein K8S87_01870 [Planctomycetes bacterium]|nr:hypothetical protein [Planctomycetota bacterium]